MSEDEQNTEIALAFRALRDAQRNHGCLVAKARRLSKAMANGATTLSRATHPDRVTDGAVEHAASAGDIPADLPTSGEARALVSSIHDLAAEIRGLELDLERMR